MSYPGCWCAGACRPAKCDHLLDASRKHHADSRCAVQAPHPTVYINIYVYIYIYIYQYMDMYIPRDWTCLSQPCLEQDAASGTPSLAGAHLDHCCMAHTCPATTSAVCAPAELPPVLEAKKLVPRRCAGPFCEPPGRLRERHPAGVAVTMGQEAMAQQPGVPTTGLHCLGPAAGFGGCLFCRARCQARITCCRVQCCISVCYRPLLGSRWTSCTSLLQAISHPHNMEQNPSPAGLHLHGWQHHHNAGPAAWRGAACPCTAIRHGLARPHVLCEATNRLMAGAGVSEPSWDVLRIAAAVLHPDATSASKPGQDCCTATPPMTLCIPSPCKGRWQLEISMTALMQGSPTRAPLELHVRAGLLTGNAQLLTSGSYTVEVRTPCSHAAGT